MFVKLMIMVLICKQNFALNGRSVRQINDPVMENPVDNQQPMPNNQSLPNDPNGKPMPDDEQMPNDQPMNEQEMGDEPKKPSLSPNDLCGTGEKSKFDNFKVSAAFKIGKHICLVGKLWIDGKSEDNAIEAAVRVTHWVKKDHTGAKSHMYLDAKPWDEIKAINDKTKINYAINTDNMIPLFEDQKMSELVYMVQRINTTTAYQFNYSQIESSKEPTFDPMTDKKMVYHPNADFDFSGYFGLKFLFMHIPYQLRILAIMVFDKPWNHETGRPKHYALIYTEEMVEGKPRIFRHYMRSDIHTYIDYRGSKYNFYRLDWQFDQNMEFCSEVFRAPTAVSMLRKEELFVLLGGIPPRTARQTIIHFAEFYGLEYIQKRLVFDVLYDKYMIETEDNGRVSPNAQGFLSCKSIESAENVEPIDCGDYPKDDNQIMGAQAFELDSNRGSSGSVGAFSTIVIILFTILILVVLGIGIYLVLISDK